VYPNAAAMVTCIADDHEVLVRNLRADIETIDEEFDDVASEDFLTGVLEKHQIYAWMTRAYLEERS
jgi:starvation-inducible DNA-binding protein